MAHYDIDFIGKKVRLSSDNPQAMNFFDLLFKDMKSTDENASLDDCICHIMVKNIEKDDADNSDNNTVKKLANNKWRLNVERFFDSEYEVKYQDFSISSDDDLCFHLLDAVLYFLADNCHDAHLIHGASVSIGESAVLLPGSSGAGKTTLMTWLVKQGFAYQTDEMVCVYKDYRMEAFRRSLQVKNHGFDIVGQILKDENLFENPEKSGIVKGQRFAILPWHLLNPEIAHPRPRLKVIIFPNYQKGRPFSLDEISPAKTSMELMGCHINARNLMGHGVPEIANIARNIKAYQLTYETFEQLETHLLPLLKHHLN